MPSIDQLRLFLERAPEDVFLNFGLAMAYSSANRVDEAYEQFDETLRLDPDYIPAYFQKAQLLARQGREEAAVSTLEKGIEAARKVGDEHALGEMLEYLGGLRS